MKNKYALYICCVLLNIPCFALAKSTFHFQGKAFNAKIEYNCKEGNLTCNDILLKSSSLKNNSSITLKGEAINTRCPDVCDFQGYQFKNGEYEYSFYPSVKEVNLWDYIVTYKDKVIAQDVGTMK